MDIFLEVTLKTTLVFIAACVVTRLLERSSAAIRHLVWAAAAVLALTFPAAVAFGPAWQLPLWPRVEPKSFVDASAPIEPSGESSIAEVSREIAKATSSAAKDLHRSSLYPILVAIWFVGFAVGMARVIVGWIQLYRIVRRSNPITDQAWVTALAQAAESLNLKLDVALLLSGQVQVPGVCGLLKQYLLLPMEAIRWDKHRTRLVLLHELAHVKRRDCTVQGLADLACALHWFNPFVFITANRIRREQELACDDLVLESGANGPEYAKQLLELVLAARPRRFWDSMTVRMARSSHIGDRVVAILNRPRNRRSPSIRLGTVTLATACLALTPLATVHLTARVRRQSEPLAVVRSASPVLVRSVPPAPGITQSSAAQRLGKKPDFSGTWTKGASGAAWPFGSYQTWIIRQTKTELHLDASSADQSTYHMIWYFNRWGKRWDSDNMHQIGRAQWDGSKLVAVFGSNSVDVGFPWIFELSPDGKQIVAEAIRLNNLGLSFDFKEASISLAYVRRREVYVKAKSS